MKPLIIANWKCNPISLKEAKKLFNSLKKGIKNNKKAEIIIFPPFIYLSVFKKPFLNFKLGAQDCFWEEKGAFTGEISPKMLKDLGVSHVIIGHSERRKYLKENYTMVNKKLKVALKNNLKPIFCVGSMKRGKKGNEEIRSQLEKALEGVKRSNIKNIIFTYEPIWAISTTKGSVVATPENTKEGAILIRKTVAQLFGQSIKVKVIYGGSVDSTNIKGFIEKAEMDGVLIGAVSLRADDFIRAVKNIDPVRSSQEIKSKSGF